jgi:predicted GNAT family N-acyltransferase
VVVAAALVGAQGRELGNDDEVGAAAHEGGREGVSQDVFGRVVVKAGGRGDGLDDVVAQRTLRRWPRRVVKVSIEDNVEDVVQQLKTLKVQRSLGRLTS